MQNDVVIIDVDCTGEQTGKKYSGQFELKLFLSLRERGLATRESNKVTSGLSRTPKWDIDGFIAGLRDKWEGVEDTNKLNLTEQQINRIFGIAAASIQTGDAEADILGTIAQLNYHIVSAPAWWGRTAENLGGYDMMDYSPVVELHVQLNKLIAAKIKPEDPGA